MKFILGNPPSTINYSNDYNDWKKHEIISGKLHILSGILIGVLIAIFIDFVITYLMNFRNFNFSVISSLYLLFLIIPVHELLHIIALPKPQNTTVGFSPKKMIFYVSTKETVTKYRFLITVLLPFILLTIIPVISILWVKNETIARVALLNALASGIDLKTFFFIYLKPKGTIFKMNGSDMYSKLSLK